MREMTGVCMKKITLAAFVKDVGQTAAANALGVSPPAISKALSRKRLIDVTEHADGSFTAQEIKPFPSTTDKDFTQRRTKK